MCGTLTNCANVPLGLKVGFINLSNSFLLFCFLINLSILIASPRFAPTSNTAFRTQGLYFDVKVLNGDELCLINLFQGSRDDPT